MSTPVVALAPLDVVVPALPENAKVLTPLVEEEVKASIAQDTKVTALLRRRLLCWPL